MCQVIILSNPLSHFIVCLLSVLCLASCFFDEAPATKTTVKSRPQALATIDDQLLAVSDVGYFGGIWESGKLYWVDPNDMEMLGSFVTPQLNPQKIEQDEEYLYILSTGTFDGDSLKSTSSTITRIEKAALLKLISLKKNGATAEARAHELRLIQSQSQSLALHDLKNEQSYFVDLLISDKWLWFSSGISPHLYRMSKNAFDQQSIQWQRIDAPVGVTGLSLMTMARYQNQLLAINFNQDRLLMIDELDHDTVNWSACEVDLGIFKEEIEGAQGAIIHQDQLYYFMGLSGQLRGLSLSSIDHQNQNCQNQISFIDFPEALGQIPNQIKIKENQLYAVISGQNELWQYDLKTYQKTQAYPLPKGSQPWHMLFTKNALFLSLWGLGKLVRFQWLQSNPNQLSLQSYQEQVLAEAPQLLQALLPYQANTQAHTQSASSEEPVSFLANPIVSLSHEQASQAPLEISFELSSTMRQSQAKGITIAILQAIDDTKDHSSKDKLFSIYQLKINLLFQDKIIPLSHHSQLAYFSTQQALIALSTDQYIGFRSIDLSSFDQRMTQRASLINQALTNQALSPFYRDAQLLYLSLDQINEILGHTDEKISIQLQILSPQFQDEEQQSHTLQSLVFGEMTPHLTARHLLYFLISLDH